MITQWYVTGDTHGDFSRFYKLNEAVPENEIWGVIILGDAGLNFWLSKRDNKLKYRICHNYPNLRFYCVRGNHEARPQDVEGMYKLWIHEIGNFAYYQPEYPHIYYLIDGHEYMFGDYRTLVIGGAYSVDKYYRLERQAQGYYGGYFENELLSQEDMNEIEKIAVGSSYDLILSHTCPWSWEPRDLFLSFIDQSKVDDSMEIWMDQLKEKMDWGVWLCGHFHDDRILAPHAQMLSLDIKNLEDIMEYWLEDLDTTTLGGEGIK